MGEVILNNGLRTEGSELQFLSFLLGEKLFGIDIKVLKEVVKYIKPDEIDTSVKSLDGVIGLRGMKVPVMDLRRLFSFDAAVTEKCRIILILLDGYLIGLLVDEVREVETFDLDTEVVTPIPVTKGSSRAKGAYMKYISGVIGASGKREELEGGSAPEPGRDELVMLLNTDSLLSRKDKSALFV